MTAGANNEVPSRTEFTVGCICALHIEKAALEGMLDEVYPELDRVEGDENIYKFGRIGDHKIVIACLPAGRMGNSPAARSATDLLRSFPSIRFGLMVGIGGGAPAGNVPSDEDIRLGDVVVSIPDGTLGGVINYNHGKLVGNGKFQHTGQLNAPPIVLLNAVERLRATHEMQNNSLSTHVQTMIEQAMAKSGAKSNVKDQYEYQGSEYDFLYDASYEHQASVPPFSYFDSKNSIFGITAVFLIPALGVFKLQLSQFFLFAFIPLVAGLLFCKSYLDSHRIVEQHSSDPKQPCPFCDKSRLVYRQPRSTHDPVIHYGTIASSDTLMKHGATRDRLRKEYKIFCFEMEAAGLMNNFPCLVIRGICDYSDSHKHKIWQRYASATAAAYAKELLRAIPPVEVTAMETAAEALDLVLDGIDNLNTRLDPLIDEQDLAARNRILTWISASTPRLEQSDRFNKHEPGTCQWFLDSDQFSTWLHTPSQTLFCPGIPGAGKSVLASIVIDHLFKLKRNQNAAVVYLYCTYDKRQSRSAYALLSSVVRQLLEQQPGPIPSVVSSLHSSHEDGRLALTLEEILDVLVRVMKAEKRIFLVVDALDECLEDTRQVFPKEIQKLQASTALSFMVTARPSVESLFRDSIRLNIQAPVSDIERYLDKHMNGLSSHAQYDPDLSRCIKQGILNVVDGMFLLAVLHLNSLKDKRTKNELKRAVEQLPKGANALTATYESAVARIKDLTPNDREWSQRLLSFIVHATRPLRSDELLHALSTELNTGKIDEDDCPVLDEVLERCAGLAVHNQESDTLQLVHYTTYDFLSELEWVEEQGQAVATTCYWHLMANVFLTGSCATSDELKERARSNPFYVYATANWGYHIHDSALEEHDMVMQFLGNKPSVSACGQMLLETLIRGEDDASWWKTLSQSQDLGPMPREFSAIHLAAYFGLDSAMVRLMAMGHNKDSTDSYGQTPVCWAVRGGHEATLKLLIHQGADLDRFGERQQRWNAKGEPLTPLGWSIKNGKTEMIRILLENRADPNVHPWKRMPALSFAVVHKSYEVVRLLLENGADPNFHQSDSWAPMRLAMLMEDTELVTLLLKNRADPNITLAGSTTPLEMAMVKGNIELIRLLLENGSDPNIPHSDSKTSLGMAFLNKDMELVKLLLASGATPNNPMSHDSPITPFWAAVICKDVHLVELLLRNGANPNSPMKLNSPTTALWEAVSDNNIELVTLLLDNGANPNIDLSHSGTALGTAILDENVELVTLLLENGADLNIPLPNEIINFGIDIFKGRVDLVKLLLENKVDPNAPLHCDASMTSLRRAVLDNNPELVALLLENQAGSHIHRSPQSL